MSEKVVLSQENLFFPLPFTSATIENVIKVENKLPPVSGDKSQNIIAFKVLSVVRHRYSVKPAVGFIAPGKSLTVSFSLDPEAIKREKDPQARALPTKDTKDSIYIDTITVDSTNIANKKFLMKFETAEDEKMTTPIQQDASAFWKTVSAKPHQKPPGAAEAPSGGGLPEGVERLRLRCIFNGRDQVPDTLVMQLKHGGHGAETAPRVPPSRAPPSVVNRDSTAPPEFPPRRASVGPSVTNRNSTTARATTTAASPSSTAPAKAAEAPKAPAAAAPPKPTPPASTPAAPAAATAATPSGAGGPTASSIRAKMQHSAAAATSGDGGKSSNGQKFSMKAILNYKISYKYCAALLLLTIMCGLLDRHNVVTWLFAGK